MPNVNILIDKIKISLIININSNKLTKELNDILDKEIKLKSLRNKIATLQLMKEMQEDSSYQYEEVLEYLQCKVEKESEAFKKIHDSREARTIRSFLKNPSAFNKRQLRKKIYIDFYLCSQRLKDP